VLLLLRFLRRPLLLPPATLLLSLRPVKAAFHMVDVDVSTPVQYMDDA